MTRLLLIDDDETTRDVLALVLRADGWQIFPAANGEEAVSLALCVRPDVVLSDLQMPGLSGPALATALRSACGVDTVLLAMTATRLPACPAGFDDLLLKPFQAGDVRAAAMGSLRQNDDDEQQRQPISLPTFHRMKSNVPPAQLRALYEFALADAAQRVGTLETTADDATYRKEAHALKGSCGMIGALRLGALASEAEQHGLTSMRSNTAANFRAEIAAVQRMLDELLPSDI